MYTLLLLVQSSVTVTETPTVTTTISSDTQFYEEAPFIVGMVAIGIILCFVLLVIALCLIRPNRSQSSDKYDTLRSEKGSPLREDGTVTSGWSHERMTVSVYHVGSFRIINSPHGEPASLIKGWYGTLDKLIIFRCTFSVYDL